MTGIETLLKEKRVFSSDTAFRERANLTADGLAALTKRYSESPNDFWKEQSSALDWFVEPKKTLQWEAPVARWFEDGVLNASYNCLDRHVESGRGERIALIWEGESGECERMTYRELLNEVSRLATGLRSLGVQSGDCVAIYMPLTLESVIAMLACARIGAPHSVVFAGFSAVSLGDRMRDAGCKALITSDVGYRRGKELDHLATAREAVVASPSVKHTVVFRRTDRPLSGNEVDGDRLMAQATDLFPAVRLPAEHPLFILYTSGTTGKPKGLVHTTGGYMVSTTLTTRWVLDLKPSDVYWCTADIGWVTGHSYVVYGILSNGGTALIAEGALNYPDEARPWKMIERHRVSIFYTAPTAVRSWMREAGKGPAERFDLSSLRLLGSVGEPINPEAWMWYYDHIGGARCPIVDTYWQTETGAMMIAPLPGITDLKPGSATQPLPGVVADIVDEAGNTVPPGKGGYLIFREPWPSMARTVYGDPQRYADTYWGRFPGYYFTGDGAHRDAEGFIWVQGRVDDVLNVSGHRLGTMEIESALVSHPSVAEAAVVGKPDEIKGESIIAFVIPRGSLSLDERDRLHEGLREHVVSEIGAIARPERIFFTKALPKTRSGKIMRRLLKEFAAGGTPQGDTTTLENPSVLDLI